MRSFVRNVFSSAMEKSSVNQPSTFWPSIVFVARRSGNLVDIRRTAHLVFVPSDQHGVARDHKVRLDVVGAHVDRERVGGEGVFRAVTARPAVRDDERTRLGGVDVRGPACERGRAGPDKRRHRDHQRSERAGGTVNRHARKSTGTERCERQESVLGERFWSEDMYGKWLELYMSIRCAYDQTRLRV